MLDVAPQGGAADVAALVARAQAGDAGAFGELHRRLEPRIRAYLRYRLNNRTDLAEDLAADTLLRALEKLHTYVPSEAGFSAWIHRIAHNRLIDHLRQDKTRRTVSLDCAPTHPMRAPTGASASDHFGSKLIDSQAERALEAVEWRPALVAALQRLTPDQRAAVTHRWLEDRSIEDTARLMGKREDAIKQLQVRAFKHLRAHLAADLAGAA